MQGHKCLSYEIWCKEAEKRTYIATRHWNKNILLKGCTATGSQNYGQKTSGRSAWNSLRLERCHVSPRQLLIFERFLQLKEKASRTPNFLCNPRRRSRYTSKHLFVV
ncbi:hypothetical protein TNCV_2328441 [Trichonephila clavipes]|nr:hypothetical protein TNCV_2328441 [Trichonephila clavipes]